MRFGEGDPTEYLMIFGLNRPRFAIFLAFLLFASILFTFNILYDGTVCTLERNTGTSSYRTGRGGGGGGGGDDDVNMQYVENNNLNILLERNNFIYGNHVHFHKTSRRLPQALIIGVRKCGTRALLEMLFLHPNIQKAAGEVHFFDRDENYKKGLEWYRKKMPHSFKGQITIEKSPSYFITPEVSKKFFPSLFLFIIKKMI